LQEHAGVISKVANIWWKTAPIKIEFAGRRENFLNAIKAFVTRQLDYYNPEAKTKSGKPPDIAKWIEKGAKIFAKRAYVDFVRRQERESKIKGGWKQASQ